jgi:hypothetical protein
LKKGCQKVVKSCQKLVKKLLESWQKVGKKLVNQFAKVIVATAKNSETSRGRGRRRGRRFVVPRPGATLSHLVKRNDYDYLCCLWCLCSQTGGPFAQWHIFDTLPGPKM